LSGQPTPVWAILTVKADRVLRREKSQLDAVLHKQRDTQNRQHKLDNLLIEYSNRLNIILARPHNTVEAGSYRQFIVQLHNLRQRTGEELLQIEEVCNSAKQKVLVADQEKRKLTRLTERAEEKLRQQKNIREMKDLEAQNLIQFNLNSRMP
jgi:flagellar export protein FliJ|tara:strand:+ start:2087 stop:2542 length:456 start_codon:yes stop_codon:yes gene_type:complete